MTTDTLINITTKLSVDSINALLLRNLNLTQIANIHNVTPSAVSHYIKHHKDQIIYDKDNRDLLLTAKADRIVNSGMDHINNILDTHEFKSKDLSQLSMSTGIMFDKMRLLQNKSSNNVSIATVDGNIAERQTQREALQAELADM